MGEEMRKIIQKAQKIFDEKKGGKSKNSDKNIENWTKFEDKLTEINVETLNKMVEEKDGFKKTLIFIYDTFVNLKEMPEFLGKKTIGKIWKALEKKLLNTNAEEVKINGIPEEKEKEPEEEAKSNLKKKKQQKKKKGKKEKKTEKENEKEKNTVTDQSLTEDSNDTVMNDGQNKLEPKMISMDNEQGREDSLLSTTEEKPLQVDETERIENMPVVTVPKRTVEKERGNGKDEESSDNEQHGEVQLVVYEGRDEAEKEGIKVGQFADDHFLALKYAEIVVETLATHQQKDGTERLRLIDLINVGTFANEIANRMEAIKWAGDQRQNEKRKSIGNQWERVKEMKYSVAKPSYEDNNTFSIVCQLLMDLVGEMDDKFGKREKQNKNGKMEKFCEEIAEELHFRKFGTAIVEGRMENWENWSQKQKKLALSAILGRGKGEQIFEEFNRNLELLEKAKTQRKLDQIIFGQCKSDTKLTQFIGEKESLNFDEKTSQLFPSEKWQEINSIKEIVANLEETEKGIKLSDNGQQQNGRETLVKLRRIFNAWSDTAHFQMPIKYFLKEFDGKFETICILPDGFEHELIFGKFECDKMGDVTKCADESLNCALCKDFESNFLKKFPKSKFSPIPLLKIVLQNVQIDIKFVQIVGLKHIPRKNFSAKQMEIFLVKMAQNIHKLEENYHFDESAHNYEMDKRKDLRKKNYEDRKNSKHVVEELLEFDRITQLLEENKEKAIRQKKLQKEWKEAFYVLTEHTANLKLLQLLLCESDYLSVVNKFELNEAFAINLLDKFRRILIYLEKWAKNNHILCKSLGYLNDDILLLMLTKVFLLFPNSSMPFLIQKFFLIYSKWKWPMPVQLVPIGNKTFDNFLGWTPFGEWINRKELAWENIKKKFKEKDKKERKIALKRIRKELTMAVIMPTFGGRNVAEKVTKSSAKVMQNELKRAWDNLRNKKDTNALAEGGAKFTEKYNQFVVVECKGTKINVDKFCEFVGERLQHELFEFIENPLANSVEFCHVHPKMFVPRESQSSDLDQQNEKKDINSLCPRHWLMGIRTVGEQKMNSELKSKLRGNLRKKMYPKIKEDFEKECYHNVHLNSVFAEREELRNWYFYANL